MQLKTNLANHAGKENDVKDEKQTSEHRKYLHALKSTWYVNCEHHMACLYKRQAEHIRSRSKLNVYTKPLK